MKILYIGGTSPQACASFYADGLEALGHQVHRIDPGFFRELGFSERLQLKLTKRLPAARVRRINDSLRTLCQKESFDLILNIAENFIDAEFLTNLPGNPPTIYHSHDNNFSDGILKPAGFFATLPLYTRVFTTKSQNVEKYQALGQKHSAFLPSAYEPRVHRPIPRAESKLGDRNFAITFIGTYDYSRDRYLEAIGWENLFVWGDRWERFKEFSKRQAHITPHAIYHPDFADVISHSQMSVGLLREEAQDLHTQRTLEIPACGALQIAPRNPEILSLFTEDKEIVCFADAAELGEKTRYYLKHPEEAKVLAEAGRRRVTESGHTYLDRVRTMLASL